MLRAAIVCGADIRGPSEKVVLAFARALCSRGAQILVLVRGDAEGLLAEAGGSVEGLHAFAWANSRGGLRREASEVTAAFKPDVIHAFNPRQHLIRVTRALARRTGASVAVRFEDDEWGLGADTSPSRRALVIPRRLASAVLPYAWPYATRSSLAWVRRNANALDSTAPDLSALVEERLGQPCRTILPMLVDWPSPADPMPGEPPERPIVAYTGGVYRQHVEDFVLGLQGVALAREHCPSLRFVHTGGVGRGIDIHALAERAGLPPESLDLRGYVSAADLDQVLREATLVIQPGRDTPFNRLRLPSKLQRYLALGVPTITFALGAGALLTDDEVLKTHTDQPDELASQIVRLLDDEELRTQLAQAGRKAAKRLFGPEQADALMDYYRAAAGRPGG